MGFPEISKFEIFTIFVIIGVIGWGSIELVIWSIKWIINHLQWVKKNFF